MTDTTGKVHAFTFGDAEPVLSSRDFSDYYETWINGSYYEPHISIPGLAKTFRSTPYLSTAIFFKKNQLVSSYNPDPRLKTKDFSQLALDYLVFGNGYLNSVNNKLGGLLHYRTPLAKYVRRKEKEDHYLLLGQNYTEFDFKPGSICHIKGADVDQEIYGSPEYLSALQSCWLNESSTLFRRKYYNNGSHAGFIMYLTDPGIEDEDVDDLKEAMKNARGPGNFRNLFLHAPNGKKDGLQIIPVSEVAAKDEFMNVKNITRDDVLASMRTPPQLLGIIPSNAGGFGNINEAYEAYWYSEIIPLQQQIASSINEHAGLEIIKFKKFGEMKDQENK